MNLEGRTALTAEGNCDLRIVDSEITAHVGIEAGGNRSVTIENSVIRSVGPAVIAGGNRRIEIVNSQLISSEGVGIEAGGNVRVVVSGGRVEGTPVAVQTRANARLDHRTGDVVNRSASEDRAITTTTHGTARTAAEIETVVHRRKSQFVRCFERDRDVRERGARVTVEIDVNRTGRVTGARLQDSSGLSRRVDRCLRQQARRLRFPRSDQPGTQTVTFPLGYDAG